MGQVICISSQKGGVGKTTTAVNLSTAFAMAEKSCLLVDCDPQGHATLGMGISTRQLRGTLYHALAGRVPAKDLIVSTDLECLKILPGHRQLHLVETEWMGKPGKESALRSVLSGLRQDYDFVVIDTPPGLGLFMVNGLMAADSFLIPLQCDFYAMEGLRHYLRFLDLLRDCLHPQLAMEGILLTMFYPGDGFSQRIADEVRRTLKAKVFGSVIPWDRLVRESAACGKPLLLQDMRSLSSRRYLNLAREIMTTPRDEEKRKGFLQ